MADAIQTVQRLNHKETLEEMLLRHRADGINNCRETWNRAAELQRYANESNQWGRSLKSNQSGNASQNAGPKTHNRVGVNEITQIIQTLSGRQMMQRLERKYEPRSAGQAFFAEAMTAIDKALCEEAQTDQVESAAFKDGPGIQGVSLIRFEYDTLDDDRGKLVVNDWPVWQAMWPQSCRKINLGDRAWHRIGMWMPATEVKDRWGKEKWEKVQHLVSTQPWASLGGEISGSSRTPWAGQDGNVIVGAGGDTPPYYNPHKNELWVEMEEWRETQMVYEVGVPTAEGMTYAEAMAGAAPGQPDTMTSAQMTGSELADHKAQHLAMTGEAMPDNLAVPKKIMKYKYAYIVGPTVTDTSDIPVGQFTILFMTGFRYPQPDRTDWIGLTERLVEVQKWMNLFLTAIIKLLESNPKGVLFYEKGLFSSKKDAMTEFSSTGGTIEVPRGKLSGANPPYRYEAGGSSPYSEMVQPIFQFYREAIPRLAGFNPGALGQLGTDLRRISGEVLKGVQDAAMASNAELFDSLRAYRQDAGKLILAFIRTFWLDKQEDLVAMVGEENLQYIDPDTGQTLSAFPPVEMWTPSAWRRIAVEEVAPVGDALDSLWQSFGQNNALQTLQAPQPDTGKPLFSSEDLIQTIPRLPSSLRNKMVLAARAAVKEKQKQEAAAVKNPQPQMPPPKEQISFKDLPPEGQVQMAAQAGIQLQPEQTPAAQQPAAPQQQQAGQ